jgi:hypothetical protein
LKASYSSASVLSKTPVEKLAFVALRASVHNKMDLLTVKKVWTGADLVPA